MEMMIVSSLAATTIECLRPFRGAGHTCPSDMMIGVHTVMTAEFQSTQETLGSMQGQSLFRACRLEQSTPRRARQRQA